MKQLKLILCVIIALSTISCSSKSTPQKTPQKQDTIIVKSDCDSLIESALTRIHPDSANSDCDSLEFDVIRLSQALSDCQKYNTRCSTELANKPTENVFIDKSKNRTKIKKSNNDIQKNSNNTTEVTKLKNALQIVDSKLDSVNLKNVGLSGKVREQEREIIRLRKSTTGNNSPNIEKSGNTTNKNSKWAWILVGAAGWFIIHNVLWGYIKAKLFPTIGSISFIKKRLL